MNEMLEKALADLVLKSISTMDEAKNFLVEQTPDIVNQLLVWNFWKSLLLFFIGIILLSLLIYLNYKQFLFWKKIYSEYAEKNYAEPVLLNIPQLVIFLVIFHKLINITWFQILVAPKLWLMEYASTLIK